MHEFYASFGNHPLCFSFIFLLAGTIPCITYRDFYFSPIFVSDGFQKIWEPPRFLGERRAISPWFLGGDQTSLFVRWSQSNIHHPIHGRLQYYGICDIWAQILNSSQMSQQPKIWELGDQAQILGLKSSDDLALQACGTFLWWTDVSIFLS